VCLCEWQRLQRREQFDVLLKEREHARAAAIQKYVSAPSSAGVGGTGSHLQSVYSSSPHGTLPTGSASLLMLAAADRA